MVFVALASLAATTLTPQAGAAPVRSQAPTQVVLADEDEGADCAVGTPPATSSARLPDPFTRIDGTRITSRSDWRCRRAEIKELAERSIYGQKPPPPQSVTGTVSSTGITVNVSDQGRSASFSASVSLPSGSGPFPAVVVLGGFGADTTTIRNSGAAVINFDPLSVGREGTPRNNKQGAFYSIYGSSSGTGLLAAWAWGVSRIIDVIEQSGGTVLRADATGVTGCSRYGKGAFAAGAFDQRIALTMPIESGTAGAPILRGIPGESGSQPLSSAYGEQPWLGDAFGSYTSNPASLPVDMHEVVAMIAPRGLFIMENPHIDWLGARSGSVAALGGAEVYKALGEGDNITYWSDIQDGNHCAVRNEWRTPLQQHIQKFLLQTGDQPGVFRVSPNKSGNLAEWRDWQTPALTTGGPQDPPDDDDPPPASDGCRAASRVVSSWNGGFQAEVTVTNDGSAAIGGWTVQLVLPSGATVNSLWNGERTGSSGTISVRPSPHNASLPAGGSTTFGLVAGGGGTSGLSGLACTPA
ncbi:cellulose binding domain-containing protein [Streptomyces sp. SBT349]|uniref:glucuronyl esterase domain-containing protein n=1 Tax=Streptomyces sp. SBT349 TaxID=1580539 RepID=UPI000AC08B4C|nr:cellulose binding domain-containing protein [Streptomyces sp. SBT349]